MLALVPAAFAADAVRTELESDGTTLAFYGSGVATADCWNGDWTAVTHVDLGYEIRGVAENVLARCVNLVSFEAVSYTHLNATDLADYLVTKGLPFRSAYKISGELVAYCIAHNTVLEKLPLETFRTFSDLFDDGVYDAIDLTNCVTRRVSYGGTSVPSVEAQITWVTQQLLSLIHI